VYVYVWGVRGVCVRDVGRGSVTRRFP